MKVRKQFQMKPSVFRLQGGLGNQLFIYFAGKYYEQYTKTVVAFDTSIRQKGMTDHGFNIEDLGYFFLTRKINFFANHLNRIGNALQTRGIPGSHAFQRITAAKTWHSPSLGYVGDLATIPENAVVSGYFQTYKYVASLDKSIVQIPLVKEILNTNQARELAVRAEKNRPIVVHVRRGDYVKLSETFGLLSSTYYESALRIAEELKPNAPIWIFSDDIQKARDLIKFKTTNQLEFISVPADDAVTTLALMTQGIGHIVSNSTFAWWGSYLSESSEFTIAPATWFKSMETPNQICPPAWRLIQSNWE